MIESEVRQEEATDIQAGEVQRVRLQMKVTHENEEYGHGSTIFSTVFTRSDDGDGFLWTRSFLPPNPSKEDSKRTFNLLHIIGTEDAVKYIEEHYGPVTNSYPTLTDPE